MTTDLLLVAHGSRDPRFGDTARRIRRSVARALPRVDVELGFLDLDEPRVAAALANSPTREPTRRVVVPLLLAPGYHSTVDLPGLVSEHARGEVVVTDVIGRHGLATALADRLREAGLRADDGIIVSAVGSSNPDAALLVRRRAVELSTLLHQPVEVVFATQLGTGHRHLRSAIRRLGAAGATRIALSPYFLSAGLLTDRVEDALDELTDESLVAGPIGSHPDLIRAVVESYSQATAIESTLT